MDITLEEYLEDIKRHLFDYQSDEDKKDLQLLFSFYDYKYEEILNNKEYFKKCMDDGLSTYKALLFFDDYLQKQNT